MDESRTSERARARAELLDRIVTTPDNESRVYPSDSIQGQNLTYHRAVGERLDDRLVADARAQLRRMWRMHPRDRRRWSIVLTEPNATIARLITERSYFAYDLRRVSPFIGLMPVADIRRFPDVVSSFQRLDWPPRNVYRSSASVRRRRLR
jgi:hypothetical protein